MRSVSGAGTGEYQYRPRPASGGTGTGPDRHQSLPAPTGTDRHRPAPTGLDQPGLFYDVFDKNFVLNGQKRYDILKIIIINIIKQPGPVGAGLVRSGPVCAVGAGVGWCRSVPVPVPLTDRKKRCIYKFTHIYR